jgi:hypothetical protein
MKKLVILIFACFTVMSAVAETNKKPEKESGKAAVVSFTGVITDEKTGESLAGVEVKIEGTELKTYTDFDGRFNFTELKPGNYNVVANYISYNKISLKELKVGDTEKVAIKMQAAK